MYSSNEYDLSYELHLCMSFNMHLNLTPTEQRTITSIKGFYVVFVLKFLLTVQNCTHLSESQVTSHYFSLWKQQWSKIRIDNCQQLGEGKEKDKKPQDMCCERLKQVQTESQCGWLVRAWQPGRAIQYTPSQLRGGSWTHNREGCHFRHLNLIITDR